jgi:hypothetical protein
MPSAAYMTAVLTAITEAARARSDRLTDTLSSIALQEGVPRAAVRQAIADSRPPESSR